MVGLLVLSESLTSMEDATLWSALCSTHNNVMDEMGVIEDVIFLGNTYQVPGSHKAHFHSK